LGDPTEQIVADDAAAVRAWVQAWSAWSGAGEVRWEDRHWPRLGRQRVPVRLSCTSPYDVASIVGEAERWKRGVQRYQSFADRWTALRRVGSLSRHFDWLCDAAEEDVEIFFALVLWLDQNRNSGLYLRQLPVAGLDTKWIDAKRRSMVTDLVRAMWGADRDDDFFELCGVRRTPHRIRMRCLCSSLSESIGGLRDVEAPLHELVGLRLAPERIVIVENLETGIALPELRGCVAFMKLGAGVGVLGEIPWVRAIPTLYWGDIDTHGFVILDRARAALPNAQSLLMDEATLLPHRVLWTREADPHRDAALPCLTAAERATFDKLRADEWGTQVRLEQERVPWPFAMEALRAALATG
jgi:hypothetical protein